MEDKSRYPRLRLRIMLAPGQWLGPGKADLLEGCLLYTSRCV